MSVMPRQSFDRALGMDRSITRRDFLQGVALAVGASSLGCSGGRRSSTADPPLRTGLLGQDVDSTRLGHRLRDRETLGWPERFADTGEDYDLIVVGAGLSGLATAHVYLRETKGRARILLLDNHDDFGGHARRNTFEWQGTTRVAPGGTFALEEPEKSPPEAVAIFEDLGIDPRRLESFRDPDFRARFGLSPGVFFDPRSHPDYSGARPSWVSGFHETPYADFFARAPIPPEARRELTELYTTRKNYLAGEAEPERILTEMSWERFIREKMRLGDAAVRFAHLYATDLIGLGCDAVSALAGYQVGPGFSGMGGEGFYEKDGVLRYGYQPLARYPDGNHTIARHLLKSILPAAVPGPRTMEGVFNSRVDYSAFDRAESPVRLRLRSMVVRVSPIDSSRVAVDYLNPEGRGFRATARHVIVAAWGMVAKHVVPGLSPEQREALGEYRYTSAVYINVLLRHWKPIAELGLFEMYVPDGYCTWMQVSDPLRLGEYAPKYEPEQPTVLSLYKYLYRPGLPPLQQMILGRTELEEKPFAEFEREIRVELNRWFGPWGFSAADDILAITVNRWGHGYNFFKAPGVFGRKPPYETGRLKMGRISFAGADAGGSPWTQLALQQGCRAAVEQLETG